VFHEFQLSQLKSSFTLVSTRSTSWTELSGYPDFTVVVWPERNSTNRPKNFPAGFALPKQATGFELAK
jgi:hypothetical protein